VQNALFKGTVRTALQTLFNSVIKINHFRMEVAQIAVCSQINIKYINTVWAEGTILNVELVGAMCNP
jgi:hypothetical protein